MNDIGIPDMLATAADVAERVLVGQWVVWAEAWETRGGISTDEWRERAEAAMEEKGVPFEAEYFEGDGLTFYWNKLMPPSRAQIEDTISVMREKLKYERQHGR